MLSFHLNSLNICNRLILTQSGDSGAGSVTGQPFGVSEVRHLPRKR